MRGRLLRRYVTGHVRVLYKGINPCVTRNIDETGMQSQPLVKAPKANVGHLKKKGSESVCTVVSAC